MVVEPKVRDFICTTAHPIGCRENVKQQIAYTKKLGAVDGPKKVLVIGSSTGYGLASRITAAYGCQAATLGVMFERAASGKRTATAGWYNNLAFEQQAQQDGLYAKTINGDAFSQEVKDQIIQIIRQDLGQVDMVVYSLAAPRRTMADGTVYRSVLKTVGEEFKNKNLDLKNRQVTEACIPPASEEEIEATVKVMGGEDWMDWMKALAEAGVLASNSITVAYSYIGPALTHPIYYNGTIGMAKKHLYQTSIDITEQLRDLGVKAYISVNKALVTQASAAIPVVPLYITILYKVMKEKGLHEGCIEQMNRLFREKLGKGNAVVDSDNQIRLDDYEMKPEIQQEVMKYWDEISSETIDQMADVDGYWEDFYHMFGFQIDGVDYTQDVEL